MYKPHTFCRACGFAKPETTLKAVHQTQSLVPVLDLGIQPLANDFTGSGESSAGYAPLKLLYCPQCSLPQLSVVVDPEVLYLNYNYVTSNSQTMLGHFASIREDIVSESTATRSVLEIGSNDGLLLSYIKGYPFSEVTGMDPASNLATIAESRGVKTHSVEFRETTAYALREKFDVVIARHVMCHIDNWKIFINALKVVSHRETLICIEVPHALDMIKSNSWDQVYHEHLSYMTIRAMRALLNGSGLHISRILHYPIHGGAIMFMLRHDDSTHTDHQSATDDDNVTSDQWRALSDRAELMAMELSSMVSALVAQGKTVVGYGASAKSTVWVSSCKFSRREINFICDETPTKQWKFSPGTDIPIVDPGALTRELPDYAICFAWNFADEIIAKEPIFKSKGGRWIIPVPKVRIV